MTEAEAATPPRPRSRSRAFAVWTALCVAGALLLLSAFAVWVNRVALNTSVFTATSSRFLADDAIRKAIATRVVDELFASVDVQAEVERQLPDDYKSLSGPAAAGLRQASYAILERALEQPRLQSLFEATLRESHRSLVVVLEGGGSGISVEQGVVTLDLGAIIDEAAERIGLGAQLSDKIPADAGRIVVLRSDELDTAQDAFRVLQALAWFLPLLTLAAFGLAVGIAPDRRRAVRGAGIVIAVVGAVGLLAANLTRTYLVEALVASRDDREAANHAWDVVTELLRGSFRFLIVVGFAFLIATWLAGTGRRALAARRALAPLVTERVWAYVGLGVVLLLLVLASDVTDVTRLLVLVLVAALGALWIELTRRQTRREFPEASGAAYLADVRHKLRRWWDERRRTRLARAAPSTQPALDLATALSRLAELHRSGELSDDEYAAAKARLIGGG
ncbi:MAG: hypothetical protein KatS3mg012_2138 [Gaiellaceae bacterium]|nr:MAG: hypothetical protein KatS3mg012_2138 [Gaiellaceae bacterium]